MRHYSCYGDDRQKGFCVHCGGAPETKDHIPSKALLDEPLPANVHICPACFKCNNELSPDEEYLACLLDCTILGDVDPSRVARPKVAHMLRANQRLADRLRRARHVSGDHVVFDVEEGRVKNALLKLARGHAAYELNEPRLEEPNKFWFRPFCTMTADERENFEEGRQTDGQLAVWPEVGSRMMSRLLIADGEVFEEGWITVQEGRYRFHVSWNSGVLVRMVLGEYLACEVEWE